MMCAVFDVRDPRAKRHAIDLGVAMQLTNICRDVLEDAQCGRVHLPAERLAMFGATPQQLLDGSSDPVAVSLVVSDLLTMAEGYYESGDAGVRGSNPLPGRVVVPWIHKVWWVISATKSWVRLSFWRASRRPTSMGTVDVMDNPAPRPASDTASAEVKSVGHTVGHPH